MRKLSTGVIFKGDKYLILRRKHGWRGWEFVKGNTDGEPFRKALLREIREETGLKKVKIVDELKEIVYSHNEINGHTSTMQKGFLVETLNDKIKTSFEHSGFKWVTPKQARRLLTFPTHKTFLALAERARKHYRRDLIDQLSHKHVASVKFDGHTISLRYDGKKLVCKVVKKKVRDIGLWSKRKKTVYYDRHLQMNATLPILVHEVVEKYTAQTYGLDTDTEAHKIATAVEKEFVVNPKWISQQRRVATAWVATNKRKVGKAKFF